MNLFETSKINHIFVYDLEFIGDVNNVNSCQIWDISVLYVKTGEIFNAIIDPDPNIYLFPPPVVKGLFKLTRGFLSDNNAKTFPVAWHKILSWVNARTENESCVFISHNNFSSDKPVLENHVTMWSVNFPMNWYFFDSLNYFRDNIKMSKDYSLKGLVTLILNKTHLDAHRAETDTRRLYECLQIYTNDKWNLTGPCYPPFMSSLRILKGVGNAAENAFFMRGITCEEYLVQQVNIIFQMANSVKKEPRNVLYQFIFDILKENNIPADNINKIVQSILFRNNLFGIRNFTINQFDNIFN